MKHMSNHWGIALIISTLLAVWLPGAWTNRACADDDKPSTEQTPLASLNWIKGPSEADIGGMAQIKVPEGYLFIAAKDTQKLLAAMENLVSGNELGLIGPESMDWFVVFEFSEIGYVKDEEKDTLDADAMLKTIRENSIASNKERKKRGWTPLNLVGWEVPPRYDPQTQNLEWALRFESEGRPVVNFNTRRLGRKGVMEVALVVDPDQLTATLPTFKALLDDYAFKGGHTYAEYRQGDKIAKLGLAALVTGGAVAWAAKTGLLSKLWKPILVGLVAIGAFIKRLFGRKTQA
jgi:uncharacterized membrane-anchored protein